MMKSKEVYKYTLYLIRLEDIWSPAHTDNNTTSTFLEKCLNGTEFDSRLELSFFASSIVFLTERWCSSIRWRKVCKKTGKVHNEEYLDYYWGSLRGSQWLEHSLVRARVKGSSPWESNFP